MKINIGRKQAQGAIQNARGEAVAATDPTDRVEAAEGDDFVELNIPIKIGQPGCYSTMGIEIRTRSYHPGGEQAKRDAFRRDFRFALEMVEEHAAKLNEIRHSIGQVGNWEPPTK